MSDHTPGNAFTPAIRDPADPGFGDYVRSLSTDEFKQFLAQALDDEDTLTNEQLQETAPPQYAEGDVVAFFPAPKK